METAVDILPFHQKDLIPKDRVDRGLFVFMTTVIPLVATWEAYILLRHHGEFNTVVAIHLIAEVFVLVNIIGNLYYMKRIDASGKQKSLPAILLPGWRYCHFCELNSPPRSYHCPVCNECILKRDKHCMFAGCCIGFNNQRYYLMALFYVWIGSMYSFLYQMDHFIDVLGGPNMTTLFKVIAPHIALVTGFLGLYAFIITTTQLILLLSSVLTACLFVQQLICISRGQTIHERSQNVTKYNIGVYRNFEQVLGKQWGLAILSPFFSSELPGDGLYFRSVDDQGIIKGI